MGCTLGSRSLPFPPYNGLWKAFKNILKGQIRIFRLFAKHKEGGHVGSVLGMSWVSFFEIFAGVHFPSPMNGDVVFVGSKKANCHSERMVDGTQVAIDLRVCVL